MTTATVLAFLEGKDNHIHPLKGLEYCHWQMAGTRVGKSPNTIFQILNHIIYWQDLFLDRIGGEDRPSPDLPSVGWPGDASPANQEAWAQAVEKFREGFEKAAGLAASRDLDEVLPTFRGMTCAESLVFLAQHNNHHIGQIITLCQVLGYWPAPDDTWGDY